MAMARTAWADEITDEEERKQLVSEVGLMLEVIENDFELASIKRWDNSEGREIIVTDWVDDWCWGRQFYSIDDEGERQETDMYRYIHCALRAGIDAVTGEVGVLGFTAGDLRAFFDGSPPEWVTQGYTDFDSLEDSTPLWL